jgi:hypothetical protein
MLDSSAVALHATPDLMKAVLIRPFVFALIWLSYLSKSKRVQGTYQ